MEENPRGETRAERASVVGVRDGPRDGFAERVENRIRAGENRIRRGRGGSGGGGAREMVVVVDDEDDARGGGDANARRVRRFDAANDDREGEVVGGRGRGRGLGRRVGVPIRVGGGGGGVVPREVDGGARGEDAVLEESAEGLRGGRGGVAVVRADAEGDAGGWSGVEGADARLEGAVAGVDASGGGRRAGGGREAHARVEHRRVVRRRGGVAREGSLLHRRGRHRREEGPRPRVVVAAAARVHKANVHGDGVAETRAELAYRAGGELHAAVSGGGGARRRETKLAHARLGGHAARGVVTPPTTTMSDVVPWNALYVQHHMILTRLDSSRVPNRQRHPARERCRASPGRPRRSRRG